MPTSHCADIRVSIFICRHICRHLDMSTHWPAQEQMCWHIITIGRICRHLNVLTYMSASWCVIIYVGIWTCQHIGQHMNKCVDIYVGIFITISRMCLHLNVMTCMFFTTSIMCWHLHVLTYICQHLDMSAYMSAFLWYINILGSTRANVLTN